ncbi:MAG: hypothetical protein IT366_09045 [Candidatus Hydrogenedentes bacterium]|nr:hypothetical protein [Candidatus Hydrogenedentota bacterium]
MSLSEHLGRCLFENSSIEWMSDQYRDNLGLTEADKSDLLKQEHLRAEHQANLWLKQKLAIAREKPIGNIPTGSYCYTTVEVPGLPTEEELWEGELAGGLGLTDDEYRWITVLKTRRCPYQTITDFGMYRCEFLEAQAVGFSEIEYEMALAHYGSEVELARQCTGNFLLGDQVRCCERVLECLIAEDDDTVAVLGQVTRLENTQGQGDS